MIDTTNKATDEKTPAVKNDNAVPKPVQPKVTEPKEDGKVKTDAK